MAPWTTVAMTEPEIADLQVGQLIHQFRPEKPGCIEYRVVGMWLRDEEHGHIASALTADKQLVLRIHPRGRGIHLASSCGNHPMPDAEATDLMFHVIRGRRAS